MKLSNFSVVNYRSITTARRIHTNNMTVLVGKNNEGKSNILRALTLAMDIMKMYSTNPRIFSGNNRYHGIDYKWERDYPVSLQEKNPNGYSAIDVTFDFSEQEINQIRQITGIRLTGSIPVRVSINHSVVKIDIPKRGTPAFAEPKNKQKIIEYVCDRIDFNFIPAVRTERDSLNVIEDLIDNELKDIENNTGYVEAIETINKMQKKVLDNISKRIITPMKEFLPAVQNIQIGISNEKRRIALRRNVEVIINDGTPTLLEQKGDGIKSLTALAMLNLSEHTNSVSVIAIEEPESHLHPESARQLYDTICALSVHHQVVLTTHSPLFINRNNLTENIIVDDGKAIQVKKVKEIRDVLGIKVSDNLSNAENVLIVEGEDDKIALERLLPNISEKIKKAIQSGTLLIDYIGGAGNLPYKLTFYRNLQCRYHVLLDNDEAGRKAGKEAEQQGLLSIKNTTYTVCNGSPEAEIEDCYEKTFYKAIIKREYGVELDVSAFKNNHKWSDRMEECFKSQGKLWNASIEKKVKMTVANSIPLNADDALNKFKRSFIDALVIALEEMII